MKHPKQEQNPANSIPDQTEGAGGAGEGLIQPVGYTPKSQAQHTRYPFKTWQVALLAIAVCIAGVLWFLFTAKSVRLVFNPAVTEIEVSGGIALELGGVYLLREGDWQVHAELEGYYPVNEDFSVTGTRSQTHSFQFAPLPGRVTFTSKPDGAAVEIATDSGPKPLGLTPTAELLVEAGEQSIRMTRERYQPLIMDVEIQGRDQSQQVTAELLPNWADVALASQPAGAEIFVDGESTGSFTPASVEIMAGEHEIRIKAPGHKSHRQRILVAAMESIALPEVQLTQADGIIAIASSPRGAGVTLNGRFQGETPLELAVKSGTRYRLQAFKAGFAPQEQRVSVASGAEQSVRFDLRRLTGDLVVIADPPEAELFIDGKSRGKANQTVTLPTLSHRIEIKLDGYAGYDAEITPRNGLTQELKVRLLTREEARIAALKPEIKTPQGHELVLLRPRSFSSGASRREPGRRANETIRDVAMRRLFYIARHEVTNLQFRAFAAGHDSGKFEDRTLNDDDQPVVGISWEEAALYCNWLSKQNNLPPFYRTDLGKVVGIVPSATGYRLPTEAEWAWSIRQNGGDATRFPWGDSLPPPDRHGNYADRSASHLVGRVIFGYNDNHIVAAPVGTYPPNALGIYDLSGNVAEWVNDFYEIPSGEPVSDPLGPSSADYHVIRGSGWMNGTISDLRVSFRDYGSDGRQDLGFRIARFAEPS
jgi:formylglycine-generating enzyme required for sulfatase activity